MKPILHICSLMLIIIMLTITTIAASPFIDGPEEAADCDISTLLDRVINAYTEINELRATIRIEIMDPNAAGSFSDYIVGEVLYRKPDILRLTYLEPMEWADYFILIDRKQDTMKTYQPVTDRLFVESLSGAAKSNIGLSRQSAGAPGKRMSSVLPDDRRKYPAKPLCNLQQDGSVYRSGPSEVLARSGNLFDQAIASV